MILRRLVLLLLPLLLLLASGLGLGSFSETNDDLTMVALLRGVSAGTPVANLHLYFHGYAAVWSRLYSAFPAVPWYALTLYGLLYAATVLVFAVSDRLLRTRLSVGQRLGFLVVFFGVAWLEHGFWFNYVRVPLLLAGTGVLFAAQRAPVRWALLVGLVAFGLAWLIRPSAAVLGLVAAAPGAWWLAEKRAWPLLGTAAGLALAGALVLTLTWSPTATTYRVLDVLKSNLNDYGLYHPTPRTPRDTLALAEARHWMLGDSTLINQPALQAILPLDAGFFLTQTAPGKLQQLLQQLALDYFPLLMALAVVAYSVWRLQLPRRWQFWLVQLGFVGLVLALGIMLKLPPRLALPLLDLWLLSGLVFLLRNPAVPLGHSLQLVVLVLVLCAVPYAFKTGHRRMVLRQEQQTNTRLRRQLLRQARAERLLVSDVVEETYKSDSPFADPVFNQPVRLYSLMGWPTLDPSQARWRYQLTGTRRFSTAMRRLAQRPDVVWVLSREGADLLNCHLDHDFSQAEPQVVFLPQHDSIPASSLFQLYVAEVK